MAPLTLYHFAPSAPSRGALLTIRNLNLDVNIKHLNLFAKEHLTENFKKLNPQHTVPTLDDGSFILWESRAISAYLVDSKASGNTLYPTDTIKRSLIDQRLYFDAGTLWPRIRAISYPALFLGETKIPDDKRKQVTDAFEFLNMFLEGNQYVAGSTLTIADLSILATVSSVAYAGFSLVPFPNVVAWYERMKSVPGYKENDDGAKVWGDKVKSLLTDKF